MADRGVINFGIIICCIMGILCIIIIVLWVHGIYTLKCKPHNKKNHSIYYITLFTVISYSFNVLTSVAALLLYLLSLTSDNIDGSIINKIGGPGFIFWVFGVYMMFALFILRLDLTFRNTYFSYQRRTIKTLWIIYTALVVFIPVNMPLYLSELYLIFFIVGFIGTVTFISFTVALFRMFIKKLNEIAKDQQGTQYIKNLIVKLNIIVTLSITSTFCTLILGTVNGFFTSKHPEKTNFISGFLFSLDSSMFIYIYMYVVHIFMYIFSCQCRISIFKYGAQQKCISNIMRLCLSIY